MREKHFNKIVWLLGVVFWWSCKNHSPSDTTMHHHDSLPDSSIGYLLKPVNEQIVSNISMLQVKQAMQIHHAELQGVVNYDYRNQKTISSRVAGRVEKLYIRYNFQKVNKGDLVMEIYAPELASAQQDLLYLAKNDPQNPMMSKARQKLELLGLSVQQINRILQSGRVQYTIPVYSQVEGYVVEQGAVTPATMQVASSAPGADNMGMSTTGTNTSAFAEVNTPVVLREGAYVNAGQPLFTVIDNQNMIIDFSIPASLVSRISSSQKLLYHVEGEPNKIAEGNIQLLEPSMKEASVYAVGRMYVKQSNLKFGQLVKADISVVSTGIWLPDEALYKSGSNTILFKKDGKLFVPRIVNTGAHADNMTEVTDSIADWLIASKAAFMVDSESFVKIPLNQ